MVRMVVQLQLMPTLDRGREGMMVERRPSGGDGVVTFMMMLKWAASACPF